MNFGITPLTPRRYCFSKFDSALESILLSVLSALEAEMVFIRNLVGGLLAELEDNIDHDRFKRLLHYSRRLTSFQNRAKLVRHQFGNLIMTNNRKTGGRSSGGCFGTRYSVLSISSEHS
jgi:hypothetical protein